MRRGAGVSLRLRIPPLSLALHLRTRGDDRFPSTHELEGVDDLLAEGAHVDDASALGSELMFPQCWHWIAKHQRVDNPHGGWLHC